VKRTARHPNHSSEAGLSRRVLSPTALALFLVFAVTACAGGNIIAFERMGVQAQNSLLASYAGTGGTLGAVLDTVSEWTHTTSVATRARSLLVKMVLRGRMRDIL
jgi:hypothetical protein